MSTETQTSTQTETPAQIAETVATTAEQTILQMSPELIAALAATNPQAAAVAAVTTVAIQIITDAVKQLAVGKITSAELAQKVTTTAESVQATHTAWAKFAAAAGVPETSPVG